ncbi:unnamed protein product [Angiostrongylus costaricensis]|uniref:Endo/exonuclease/phosphatase domain-containing protein n=1 Tax=Angiostrongylus costaricensis TaxID=334426 RepID=A0A0R3PDU8_ANGCS|nr:unnamed protein product [Angiostrongylus costaricensis]
MSQEGYAAYYKRRRGLSWDGCAVFVRRSKLEVVSYRTVEYFVGPCTSMDRDQIGQILRIRSKETRQEFIFANTHLLFDPLRGDIKLGQLAMLIANIEDELTKSRCPVILCGDFNIEPHSYIYKYIIESSELSGQGLFGGPYVEADRILPPTTNIGRDSMFINNESYREPVNADCFTHPLRLASVYHHVSVNGESNFLTYTVAGLAVMFRSTFALRNSLDLQKQDNELKEISTYHREVANPDFLFYSVKQKLTTDSNALVLEDPELRLLRRLSLPGLLTMKKTCGPWPNRYVPSDHVPLVADFILSNLERLGVSAIMS